jgi:hypothetical protein
MKIWRTYEPVMITIVRAPQAMVERLPDTAPAWLPGVVVLGAHEDGPRDAGSDEGEPTGLPAWTRSHHLIEGVPLLGPNVFTSYDGERMSSGENIYVAERPAVMLLQGQPLFHPNGRSVALSVTDIINHAPRDPLHDVGEVARVHAGRAIMSGDWPLKSVGAGREPYDRPGPVRQLILELQESGGRALPRQALAIVYNALPEELGTGRPPSVLPSEPKAPGPGSSAATNGPRADMDKDTRRAVATSDVSATDLRLGNSDDRDAG